MPGPLQLAIVGAHGRMGRALIAAASHRGLRIAALVVRPGSAAIGAVEPTSGLAHGSDLAAALGPGRVAVEFAGAGSVAGIAEACATAGVPLVSGSTGLDAAAKVALEAAARRIPVLTAANFAPGVVVLAHLAALTARALPGFEVAIEETHHVHKKDAPSGTALRLAEAVRAAGVEPTIASHREGEVIGDHSVAFTSPGERLTLVHHAAHRELFAHGALAAAAWLAGRPAGRYSMEDVLGLR